MKKCFMPVIGAALLVSCQLDKMSEENKIKTVLTDYFDAISEKDLVKMKSVTTDDFILYENGKILNNDSLYIEIRKDPNLKVSYSFTNFRISLDRKVSAINYLNHGEFVINDTSTVTRDWLESASFQRVNDTWKLAFLHSTRKK